MRFIFNNHNFIAMSKRKTLTGSPSPNINMSTEIEISHTVGPFQQGPFFKKHLIPAIILLALSFGLYFNSLPYDYVLDDKIVITDNKYTNEGFGGIWDILTTESFEGYFGEKKELVQGNRYRPLSIISFAIEKGILGELNPAVSHFINILLYGLTGVVLMMVLSMLFRNFKTQSSWFTIPFLASLLFILHPIHTEAVANIKGRDEIMSMLFSLGALYYSLKFMDEPRRAWLVLGMLSYFLALLSKENAITFIAVIPLTIYYFSKTNWPKVRTLLLWLWITTILYLVLRFNTAGVPQFGQEIRDLMNNPFLGMKPAEKFGSIMYSLGKYIALMVFPHPLSHDYYPYAIPKASIFTLIPIISLMGYFALAYVGIKGLAKKSIYSYAILFYLCTLSIVSNTVINLGTFMNERFIFMASAGFCIALAYFLSEHLPSLFNKGKMLGMGLIAIIAIGFSAKTIHRIPDWKDALSLNSSAVKVSTGSARANSFMSTALFEKYKETINPNAYKTLTSEQKNLLDWSEVYGNKALEIVPDYQNANLMVIGVASERYKSSGDIKQYINTMKPCVIRRPDITFIKEFSDYLKGRGHDAELFPYYLEIGKELLKVTDRRREWAIQYLTYAYEIQPASKEVNEALGTAYELSGNYNMAQKYKTAATLLQ